MRHYLYTLTVDRGKSQAIELFMIYARDDEDVERKARKRVPDQSHAQVTLKRWECPYIAAHITYPPYIDREEAS